MLIKQLCGMVKSWMDSPWIKHISVGAASIAMTLGVTQGAYAVPAQSPLFLSNPVIPIMMLNMSNDHQLFFKVYDDYGDITSPTGGAPDGIPDTKYIHAYKYYGYFDENKCYKYNTTDNRFNPSRNADTSATNKGYCNYSGNSGEWSGNFLNWATMTRVDAIRKILYGGMRSTDTGALTVLERALLPHDAHAFAKFYDGTDIDLLTPFTVPELKPNTSATGITICNTTAGTGMSQFVTSPPLIRVVKGNYSLWASNERWQCRFDSASNANNQSATGLYAYSTAPSASSGDKLGSGSAAGEYHTRVSVCVSGLEEENCVKYPTSNHKKPTGLLQEFGERQELYFGLITGTYGKNKSGGVLRKNIGDMLDEINTTTNGTFKSAPAAGAIIDTLNKLRLYGYSYNTGDQGSYTMEYGGGDSCSYQLSSFAEGKCSNWGNPQSEIYYESLRYLAGTGAATAAFNSDDNSYISGIKRASTWNKPLTNSNFCAPTSILQFNASSTSYDVEDSGYAGLSSLGLTNAAAMRAITNKVGDLEGITGSERFVGRLTDVGSATDPRLCTAKTVTSLSNVSGTCPDSPRLDGGYHMVGLAYHARKTGIPVSGVSGGKKTVRTYGVALAPAVPRVELSVPGSTSKKVVIQPACLNKKNTPASNCAIVDFKILQQTTTSSTTSGTLYVNWEDGEQGGDYDQDMWGVIKYSLTNNGLSVTTKVLNQSSDGVMGFGYVLSGTNKDGFNVHSGINEFTYGTSCTTAASTRCTCRNATADNDNGPCDAPGSGERTQTYTLTASSAQFLQSPLYYAAKWGGYSSEFEKDYPSSLETAIAARVPSDTYFYASEPRELEEKLRAAITAIANDKGSASAVATNSTQLNEHAFLYQALFYTNNWTGEIKAYKFDQDGELSEDSSMTTTSTMPTSSAGRNLYTYNGTDRVNFEWASLTAAQKASLKLASEADDTMAQKRLDWLRGDATGENSTVGLRNRNKEGVRNILGDVINSSPVYYGDYDHRYHRLPTVGASYQVHLNKKKERVKDGEALLFVGSNDGMLHAFNADNLTEEYAYVPNLAYANSKLLNLTRTDYGTSANPHQYIVDGPISIADAYVNNKWRSVLVGTMGAGGRGIYALDVTGDAPEVLFELSESDYPALGHVMGKPIIVPMKNGRWAAIFGNGDNNAYGSQLFVVDLDAPFNSAYTKTINTGSGANLGAPAVLGDDYGVATLAYAGDGAGNMWRFNLSATNASAWTTEYLLFKARDAANKVQPITAAPTLGTNSLKNDELMVYFGTGKYYDTGDNIISPTPIHSFYAIADTGTTVNRSDLKAKQMTTTYSPVPKRSVDEENSKPDWDDHEGWYLDFDDTPGERVTTKPLLIQDRLYFPTLIPSTNPCDYGGSSWLMGMVATGNKAYANAEKFEPIYNESLILGDVGFGMTPNAKAKATYGTSTGGNDDPEIPFNPAGDGRQSWRQIQ